MRIPQITQTLEEIGQISQLILIPHRGLHLLPLEAAFLESGQKLEKLKLENIAITHLPSAAFGLRNKQHPAWSNPPSNLLMVAYPNRPELSTLPYSETEAAGIKVVWEKCGKKVEKMVENLLIIITYIRLLVKG